jgi:hypothetical protein
VNSFNDLINNAQTLIFAGETLLINNRIGDDNAHPHRSKTVA